MVQGFWLINMMMAILLMNHKDDADTNVHDDAKTIYLMTTSTATWVSRGEDRSELESSPVPGWRRFKESWELFLIRTWIWKLFRKKFYSHSAIYVIIDSHGRHHHCHRHHHHFAEWFSLGGIAYNASILGFDSQWKGFLFRILQDCDSVGCGF